jgi:amidase
MFNFEEATLNQIQAAFDSGELTSFDLTAWYLERIADIDKSGPCLNSVLEINPEALFIAEAMDRERKLKGKRGILHGVPVMVKDSINTHDKMHTSAGSLALADNFAPYDATVVKKLRQAGAVILGKTNMTEFANYMTKAMKNGYSSRGGQVLCPYNPDGNAWGSSTGSAVAVSPNLCAGALGTETNGSVIWPSHNNGVVGIKPTLGSVSRYGVIPISTAQDTVGVIARTVEDAAALLGVIAGYDENDAITWSRDDQIFENYTQFLDKNGLAGLRIGVNKGTYDELTEEQKLLADKAYDVIANCGAELVPGFDLPRLRCDREILFYEFKQSLNAYISTCSPALKVKSLQDIIDSNNNRPDIALKYGQSILLDVEHKTSGTLTEAEYLRNRVSYLKKSRDNGVDKLMNEDNVDIYVTPGISDASPISGYPSIVVPIGFTSDNMPFGLTFVGRAFFEPLLIKAAYAFEQAMQGRRAPVFKKASDESTMTNYQQPPLWAATAVNKINYNKQGQVN